MLVEGEGNSGLNLREAGSSSLENGVVIPRLTAITRSLLRVIKLFKQLPALILILVAKAKVA
ncbi:hypothetical protein CGZ75_13305 [Paenibacillus herberti]|uniref:Uncharacterized protein n=1 Tax=Paenibacillus herberti TaxID=1619309 RepID=A0A229NVT9_9BACL|nr:hypothetical protein CGZ75_13305 [Paenibacillus herberti]